MFSLYLLAEGRVAYFGSMKKAETFFSGYVNFLENYFSCKSLRHRGTNLICQFLFRLGFEAPMNYNLADFYIQTLAIAAHDREASLERIEVRPNDTVDNKSFIFLSTSTFVIDMKNLLSTLNMSMKYSSIMKLTMTSPVHRVDYSNVHQSVYNK